MINITLTDVNNKSPKFDRKSYVGHVNERSSLDDFVLTIHATDPDKNAKLVYSIVEPIFAYDKTGVTLESTVIYNYKNAFK